MAERVRIFSTTTCPYCKQAKDFLASKGIKFEDFDVITNPEALREMREISGGARTVPVIVIDDTVLVGYDEQEFTKVLKDKGLLK